RPVVCRRPRAGVLRSFPTRRSSDLLRSAPRLSFPGVADLSNLLEDPLAHRALEALVRAETRVTRRLAHQLERRGVSATGFSMLRSEEHTSELQSQSNLVCRLLLEKQ